MQVSARYEEDRFNDGNALNKVAIEDMFTNMAGEQMSSDALCVCGPNYRRHASNIINRITTTKNAVFAVAEIESSTRDIIEREMGECPVTARYRTVRFMRGHSRFGLQKGLPMIYGNVLDIKRSFRFEDLDLTASWDNTFDVFYDRLKKQSENIRTDRLKCMIFTVSERRGGGPLYSIAKINGLLQLLNAELSGFNNIAGGFSIDNKECNSRDASSQHHKYVQHPNWLSRGRIAEFRAYKYSDSGNPMFTFMAMYY